MELDKITQGSPLNSTYDLGSKKIYNMRKIVDSLMEARHQNKWIINIPAIDGVMNAVADG
jgi:dihydroxyacetone kinase DhaKLM complex PTS-EIIA-like component DhaM